MKTARRGLTSYTQSLANISPRMFLICNDRSARVRNGFIMDDFALDLVRVRVASLLVVVSDAIHQNCIISS